MNHSPRHLAALTTALAVCLASCAPEAVSKRVGAGRLITSVPGSACADEACPERDRDGDEIADDRDRCPAEPETQNGIEDDDGCPEDIRELVEEEVARTRFILPMVVLFEEGGTRVRTGQEYVIDDIAEVLLTDARGYEVVVEGHASDWGSDEERDSVAIARALYIRGWLIARGVHPERLLVRSFGAKRPRKIHGPKTSRMLNDRVEVKIQPRI
ncbi:MAG: OmpA family protein [Myxococcota bacterium]